MKRIVRILFATLIVVLVAGNGFASGTQEPAAAKAQPGAKKVAVIIKATDSDFWQYVLVGARNYARENPSTVSVTEYGPASEADIDKQVAILEDVVNSKPDAIVIASTSSDATVPAIERAVKAGIPVVTIDNRVNTSAVVTLLSTDNRKGGAMAADMLIESMKKAGTALKGKVGIVNAMAGVQVLIDREDGFRTRMAEIAPGITLLPTRFIDNDILKGLAAAQDMMTANPDMVGFFGANNHSGDGVARALREMGKTGKVHAVAYDSDPEEIQALTDGVMYALILQDPYGMGYKGVDTALKALAGQKFPPHVDTGATAVTKENMDRPEIKGLLDPMTLAK